MDIDSAIRAMVQRFKHWVHLNNIPHTDAKYQEKATELNAIIDGFNQYTTLIEQLRRETQSQAQVIVEYERRLSLYGQSITADYQTKYYALQAKYNEIASTRNIYEQMLVMRKHNIENGLKQPVSQLFKEDIRRQSLAQLQQDMPHLF